MQMYALKQTMLCQETMFRKQVLELHRLYAIQTTMMQSYGYYEYGGHDLRNVRDMSNLFIRTKPARDDTPATERKEESKSFYPGLLDLNEAYPDDSSCSSNDPIVTQNHWPESSPYFSGGISANLNNIGAQRLISGKIEYSDDQTEERRSENTDLFCEPKSGKATDDNCRRQSNDSESVAEYGPATAENTPVFSSVEIGSQVSKTTITGEQEWISSKKIESKEKIIDMNEESGEVDPSIQNAAILLVNMSTENSPQQTNCDRPQCSSDSFEMIALNLRQNSSEDYSVSSRRIETIDGDKRDYSLKLRRGRRLKDFQKEILPGLATLSRHEICEDIDILEAVLRSRECKKSRSNMEGGNKWRAPVRSKRSTVRRRLLLEPYVSYR